jgi:hypothetical protein
MRIHVILSAVLVSILTLILAFPGSSAIAGDDVEYVGAHKCKMCHSKQFKSWQQTKMAKSFDILKKGQAVDAKKKADLEDKDYTEDPKCLKCHATGYGSASGYRVMKKADKKMDNLKGVTCEACHGPGSVYGVTMKKHRKDYKRQDLVANEGLVLPNQDSCVSCHNSDSPTAPKDYKFAFDKGKGIHAHKKLKYEH